MTIVDIRHGRAPESGGGRRRRRVGPPKLGREFVTHRRAPRKSRGSEEAKDKSMSKVRAVVVDQDQGLGRRIGDECPVVKGGQAQ